MRFTIYLADPTQRPQVLARLSKVFTITKVSKPCKAKNGRFWRLYVWLSQT